MTDFERRLDELRRQGLEGGRVDAPGIRPAGAPFPSTGSSGGGYYGLPLLKAPVWTWEVPAYFFVGGAAGAAAVIGAVAGVTGGRRDLVRDARWMAAAGAAASAPLLIADLGRPDRFLNMLRVFKLQSPMSVGVWTLVAFSNAAAAAACAELVHRTTRGRLPVKVLGDAAGVLSAATGLVLSTYTGVLIGATAIPVWSQNVRILPIHFGASGVGTAVSILELMGHGDRALHAIGIGAAAVETAIGLAIEGRRHAALDPLKEGWSGRVTRTGGVLSGPVPLALRVFAGRSRAARRVAAASTIVGSLLTRVGWLAAGRRSAERSAPALESRVGSIPSVSTSTPETRLDTENRRNGVDEDPLNRPS
jgi:formate-dependent nitrite reductase membrane component NrfD